MPNFGKISSILRYGPDILISRCFSYPINQRIPSSDYFVSKFIVLSRRLSLSFRPLDIPERIPGEMSEHEPFETKALSEVRE